MRSKDNLKRLLGRLVGTKNTLSNNVLFIDFTGSHEKAQFLSQLWYWSDKAKRKDGFFAKSYSQWFEEIRIKDHSIRRYTKEFEKLEFLQTKLELFNRKYVLHYYLDRDKLTDNLLQFVTPDNLQPLAQSQGTPCTKSGVPLAQSQISYTENITENTTESINAQNAPNDKVKKEEDLNNEFEEFWNLYDKKVDKKDCWEKWNNLSKNDKKKIFEHVPSYKIAQPEKQYRKDPIRYLRKRAWENEVIKNVKGETPVVKLKADDGFDRVRKIMADRRAANAR